MNTSGLQRSSAVREGARRYQEVYTSFLFLSFVGCFFFLMESTQARVNADGQKPIRR